VTGIALTPKGRNILMAEDTVRPRGMWMGGLHLPQINMHILIIRWWLEGGSRQRELHKSKILMRRWSHTWQKKTTKNKQNSDTLSPQPTQSFSTPRYTEKPGGLPCHQMPTPNLLGRRRLTGEQISGTWYSYSHLWNKPA
jgi:hypothetical protein